MDKAGIDPVKNRGARTDQVDQRDVLEGLPQQASKDIVDLASYICGTPAAHISLFGAEGQGAQLAKDLVSEDVSIAQSFSVHTLNTGKSLVIEDATLDPRFADNPFVLGEPEIRFYAGAPFRSASGQVLGMVCVLDTVPRSVTEKQQRALEALARQVEVLLHQRATEKPKLLKQNDEMF